MPATTPQDNNEHNPEFTKQPTFPIELATDPDLTLLGLRMWLMVRGLTDRETGQGYINLDYLAGLLDGTRGTVQSALSLLLRTGWASYLKCARLDGNNLTHCPKRLLSTYMIKRTPEQIAELREAWETQVHIISAGTVLGKE